MYMYRQLFGLSAKEMAEEPVDHFFTNLRIYAYIQDRKRIESKKASK